MKALQILVVEDENIVAKDLQLRLQRLGYVVPETAATGEDAIRLAQELCPDLILMDLVLKGEMDGIQAAAEIRTRVGTPVIFLSAYGDEEYVQRARDVQPLGYVLKPFKERELHAVIQTGLYRRQLELQLKASEEKYHRLIETAQEGIWVLDAEAKTLFANTKMAELLDCPVQALPGVAASEFVKAGSGALLPPPALSNGAHGNELREIKLHRKNANDDRWVLVSTNPITDGDGNTTGTLAMVMDITARKTAEEQLVRARDDLEIRVQERTAELARTNEILQALVGEHARAKKELEETSQKLQVWVAELERRNREMTLLNEMGDLLQSCRDAPEAYKVIACFAQKLFPNASGSVNIISASRNYVELKTTWGNIPPQDQVFAPGDCWALRRGRVHSVSRGGTDPLCKHIRMNTEATHLCVPLAAQGEALGVLHLQFAPMPETDAGDAVGSAVPQSGLVVAMGEHIALALANLALRESLRNQAIHDPLTLLFNRRYMEEILERELHRAVRRNTTLGAIMLDVDHFKDFNDTYGHATGDRILYEIGVFLRKNLRAEDVACRYGGEEFIVILPETGPETTLARAEELRSSIQELTLAGSGNPVPRVTVSLGVAVFPMHALVGTDLIQTADAALYRAKREGRNRVVVSTNANPMTDAQLLANPVLDLRA